MIGKATVPKKTKYGEANERTLKRLLQRIEKRTNERAQRETPKT